MKYKYFSHNGELLPIEQAAVPLSNIEYSYGFGVYETIRIAHGLAYFLDQHCQRLIQSAQIIGLEHNYDETFISNAVNALVEHTDADAYNIKILLIGAVAPDKANLYITCLNPHFPDRKLYRLGVKCISEQCERIFPQAKSLNMFTSYMAYRHAKQANAFDALLINRDGFITEGTRTNFFALEGRTLISPPASDCLHGVTRFNVIEVAKTHDFKVEERDIKYTDVGRFDCVFITSTVSKILPIYSIDGYEWQEPASASLKELMIYYDKFLDEYRERKLLNKAS
jgi:branched-subunit amino acid aminotransferase/4-amino-4-deoxychorismate lyase